MGFKLIEKNDEITTHYSKEEEAISYTSPLGVVNNRTKEEDGSFPASKTIFYSSLHLIGEAKVDEQHMFSLELVLNDFLSITLHSSWKRFDSSSNFGSKESLENSSLLIYDYNPHLTIDGEKPNEDKNDLPIDFYFHGKDENQFNLFHEDSSY